MAGNQNQGQQPLPTGITGSDGQTNPFTTSDASQGQANPNLLSTLGLISTLGGAGLNVAGIAHSAGAVGDQAMQSGDALNQQSSTIKKQQQQQLDNRTDAQNLAAQLPRIQNPADKQVIQGYLQNEQVDKAREQINHVLGVQESSSRYEDRLNRISDRYNDLLTKHDLQSANALYSDLQKHYADLKKPDPATDGDVIAGEKALKLQESLQKTADPTKFDLGAWELVNHVHLTKEERASFQNTINDQINSVTTHQGWNLPLIGNVGAGQVGDRVLKPNVDPKTTFNGFAAKLGVSQSALDAATQRRQDIETARQDLADVGFIKENIWNKSPRIQQLVQEKQDAIAARRQQGAPQQQAPAAPPAAPAAPTTAPQQQAPQRLYSPSTKKTFLKYPDGRIVPE